MRLFKRPVNFQQFEDDGNDRRYWLWTNNQGWIYRDHVMLGLQPLDRHVDLSTPEPVTKTAGERVADVRRQTREKVRARLPKRNVFGYGKSKTRLI
jgi:hypothetical protein